MGHVKSIVVNSTRSTQFGPPGLFKVRFDHLKRCSHRTPQARYFGSQLMVFEQQFTNQQVQVVALIFQRRAAPSDLIDDTGRSIDCLRYFASLLWGQIAPLRADL